MTRSASALALAAAWLALAASRSAAQVAIEAPVDVLGWERSGFLQLAPRSDDLPFLFDGRSEPTIPAPESLVLEATEDIVLTRVVIRTGPGAAAIANVTLASMDGTARKTISLGLSPGTSSTEGFPEPVTCRRVTLAFPLRDGARLSEITFDGRTGLSAVEIKGLSHEVVVGSRHRYAIVGADDHGGHIDLTHDAELRAAPPSLVRVERGEVIAAESGSGGVSVLVAGHSFGPHALTVFRPRKAPEGLTATAFCTTAFLLATAPTPPPRSYALFRRKDGDPAPPAPLRFSVQPCFHDWGLDAFTGYNYAVVGQDEHGNETTERSAEVHVRTAPNRNGLLRVTALDVLVPIYRGARSDAEVDQAIAALEWSRLFYYRHSRGRLDLALTPLVIEGPAPDTRGPAMFAIEDDLRARGIGDDWYDAVHVIADNLSGCWGGFMILGHCGGSFGSACAVPFPPGVLARDAVAWSFCHELLHSLQLVILKGSGGLPLLSHHFAENYPLPAGTVLDVGPHWDALAKVIATFNGYDALAPPWDGYLEVVDSDGDGLADQDARLPTDEARLHGDPAKSDTDGDGLIDLDELCAGLYRGTDLSSPDTDRDGVPDGSDPFPLQDFTGVIHRADAEPKDLARFCLARVPAAGGGEAQIHAWWSEHSLSFLCVLRAACEVDVHLDGSGADGRFESPGAFAGSAQKGEQARGDCWCDGSELVARPGQAVLLLRGEPVEGSVVTWEVGGTSTVVRLTIPRRLPPGAGDSHAHTDLVQDGLALQPGTVLGLNFWLRCSAAEKPFSLFEMHRFDDAVLQSD